MDEVWCAVVGFENHYEVSTYGKVRSKDRVSINSKGIKSYKTGVVLRQYKGRHGSLFVVLSLANKPQTKIVSRLVAEAFVPNPENLPLVNHKDLDNQNNHKENLEWATVKRNAQHAATYGRLHARTNPNKALALTLEKVEQIKALYHTMPTVKLAKQMNVSTTSIYNVVRSITWNEPPTKE